MEKTKINRYIRDLACGVGAVYSVLTGNVAGEELVRDNKANLEAQLEKNVREMNEGLIKQIDQSDRFIKEFSKKFHDKIEAEKKKNTDYRVRVDVYCAKSDEERYQIGLALSMEDSEIRKKYSIEVGKDGGIFISVTRKKLEGDKFVDVPYRTKARTLKDLESGFVDKDRRSLDLNDEFDLKILEMGIREFVSDVLSKGRDASIGKSDGPETFSSTMKALGKDMSASSRLRK